MLQKFTKLIDNLVVDEERMLANLGQSYRLVFSGAVLLALVDKGMLREDAYRVVQDAAMRAWREGVDFGELIKAERRGDGRDVAGGDRRRHGPGPVPGRARRDLRPAGEAGVLTRGGACLALAGARLAVATTVTAVAHHGGGRRSR